MATFKSIKAPLGARSPTNVAPALAKPAPRAGPDRRTLRILPPELLILTAPCLIRPDEAFAGDVIKPAVPAPSRPPARSFVWTKALTSGCNYTLRRSPERSAGSRTGVFGDEDVQPKPTRLFRSRRRAPVQHPAGGQTARFWSGNNGRGGSADPALILVRPLPSRQRIKTHPGAV